MTLSLVIYCAAGAVAGLLGGLLGVGGGLVIVPVLAYWFHYLGFAPEFLMQMAIGTSLATIVVTSVASVRAHHRFGAVRWRLVAALSPGILLGAWLAATLAHSLPSPALQRMFGGFEILIAAQLGFGLSANGTARLPGKAGTATAGVIIGAISSLFGIGGGTLTVPFLSWCRVPLREAIGTSAACGLPIAVAGSAAYVTMGLEIINLPAAAVGYVYLPAALGIALTTVFFAPLGARLAHQVPIALLRKVFAGFLLLVGLRMISA